MITIGGRYVVDPAFPQPGGPLVVARGRTRAREGQVPRRSLRRLPRKTARILIEDSSVIINARPVLASQVHQAVWDACGPGPGPGPGAAAAAAWQLLDALLTEIDRQGAPETEDGPIR